MTNIYLLFPEIALSVLALVILVVDMVLPPARARLLYHLSIVFTGLVLASLQLVSAKGWWGIGTLWVVDPFSLYLKVLVLGALLVTLFLSLDYPNLPEKHLGSYAALLLWSTAGMMLLISSVDFLLIFLALELISIACFILTGFVPGDVKSKEGAIKYFLVGAFSSALTVYGLSLFYGYTGTTNLLKVSLPATLGSSPPTYVLFLGLLLLLVGFGFKVSMVPFHFWVPDAYEGAPTPITAYLSVAPKVATLGILLRIFTVLTPHSYLNLTNLFALLAVLTMTVGNLSALFQQNVKRLLAYSSIAQAGTMMIGFVVGTPLGQEGVFVYLLVYLFMNMGAFAVIIAVANAENSYELSAFDGLSQRSLGLALLMSVFLLSLTGIPPLAGFIGKFYIFAAAMHGGFVWLAVIGVLNSLVSVYYYMNVIYHMFFLPSKHPEPVRVGLYLSTTLSLAAVATFVLGILPNVLIEAARASMKFLP